MFNSTDAAYAGLNTSSLSIALVDNDNAGVSVMPRSTRAHESGATGVYSVVLQTQPVQDVVIHLHPDPAKIALSSKNLTFGAATWNVSQSVLVTAVQNRVDEGHSHASTITHSVTTKEQSYQRVAVGSVAVEIVDDDVAGLTESDTTVNVSESGKRATYLLKLTSQPIADVWVNISGDANVRATPAAMLFNASTWDVGQRVTAAAVDDFVDEGSHTGKVAHQVYAAGSDGRYRGVNSSVLVHVADNDVAALNVLPLNLTVFENRSLRVHTGFGADHFSLTLNSQPLAPVKLTLRLGASPTLPNATGACVFDTQVRVVPSSLVFTAASWNTSVLVGVQVLHDLVDEFGMQLHHFYVHAFTGSLDANYRAFVRYNRPVAIRVVDDDEAAVQVLPRSVRIHESGATGVYSVVLQTQPVQDVVIHLHPDPAKIALSSKNLTFGAATWNVSQSVLVTAVQNRVDEGHSHASTITHSVTTKEQSYQRVAVGSVAVEIVDDDVAGLTESDTTVNVSESGKRATYLLKLTSQPIADVWVNISGDANVRATPAAMLFNASTWDVGQRVTAAAVDDFVDEGSHTGKVAHQVYAAGSDGRYRGVNSGVLVHVADNDFASVVAYTTAGTVHAGQIELSEAHATTGFGSAMAPGQVTSASYYLGPSSRHFSPCPVQSALLTPRVEPGSLYRCGKSTLRAACALAAGEKGA